MGKGDRVKGPGCCHGTGLEIPLFGTGEYVFFIASATAHAGRSVFPVAMVGVSAAASAAGRLRWLRMAVGAVKPRGDEMRMRCAFLVEHMALRETIATELHALVQVQPKALVMFTTRHCAVCEQLQPIFALFATNQAYADIAFLYVEGAPAPGAAPLVVAYCHGQVVLQTTVHTEQQLRAVLHALHAHL